MIKKHCFSYVFFVLFLAFFGGCAERSDVTHIESLDFLWSKVDTLDRDALVVFDVDETLITPVDDFFHIGSFWKRAILWGYYAFKTYDFLLKKGWWYYNTALYQAQFRLMDKKIPELIKKLQARGIKVMALTSCPVGWHQGESFVLKSVEDWRINQLLELGIDFSSVFKKFSDTRFPELNEKYQPLFKNGILFCNAFTRKGILLSRFLNLVQLKPSVIISVDDTPEDSQNIKAEMDKQGIDCVALHYTAEDDLLKDVDLQSVLYQMKNIVDHETFIEQKDIKPAYVS